MQHSVRKLRILRDNLFHMNNMDIQLKQQPVHQKWFCDTDTHIQMTKTHRWIHKYLWASAVTAAVTVKLPFSTMYYFVNIYSLDKYNVKMAAACWAFNLFYLLRASMSWPTITNKSLR